MRCDDAAWKLLLYADGELPPDEAAAVAAHLAECPACSAELERLRSSEAALDAALQVEQLDRAPLSRIRARVARERQASLATRPARAVRTGALLGLTGLTAALGAIALQAWLAPLVAPPVAVEISCADSAWHDSPLAVRLRVRNAATGAPIAECPVRIGLVPDNGTVPTSSAAGRTDASGCWVGQVRTPAGADSGGATLSVGVGGGFAGGDVVRSIALERPLAVYVWSGTPVAAPGASVPVGCAVVSRATGRPSTGQGVALSVVSESGKPLWTGEATTGSDGVATASARLPDPLRPGAYRLEAQADGARALGWLTVAEECPCELAVHVRRESPDAPVVVEVADRAGQPVVGSSVEVSESGSGRAWSLRTGASGRATLPEPPSAGARVVATALDPSLGRGVGVLDLPADPGAPTIVLAPRGGALIPGRQCALDVLAVGEDGTPIAAHLSGRIGDAPVELAAGPDGVAELWVGPYQPGQKVGGRLRARSPSGAGRTVSFTLECAQAGALTVTCDRGVCDPGDRVTLDLASDRDGIAEVRLVRGGAEVWRGLCRLAAGEGRITAPIEETCVGALSIAASWLDEEGEASLAPALFVRPTGALRVEWDARRTEARDLPLRATLSDRGGRPADGVLAPLSLRGTGAEPDPFAHPSLAFAQLATPAAESPTGPALRALARALVSEERPARSRRPSRVLLAACSARAVAQPASYAGPNDLRAGQSRRQFAALRGVALGGIALFGATLAALLVAGRARLRSLERLEEPDRARRARRDLATDIAASAMCLLLAAAGSAWCQARTLGLPEVSMIGAPRDASLPATEPLSLANGSAPPQALPLGLPSLRSAVRGGSGSGASDGLAVTLPWSADDASVDVLALGERGLGSASLTLRRRPQIDCELTADPVLTVGEPAEGLLRVVNATAFAQAADISLALPSGVRAEGSLPTSISLPARSVAEARFRFVAERPGWLSVRASVHTGEGLDWQGQVRARAEADSGLTVVAAGTLAASEDRVLPRGSGEWRELRLLAGRSALLSEVATASAPPWLGSGSPAAEGWLSARVPALLRGVDRSAALLRAEMREREQVASAATRFGDPLWAEFPHTAVRADLPLSSLAGRSARIRALAAWQGAERGLPPEEIAAILPGLEEAGGDVRTLAAAVLACAGTELAAERERYGDALATRWPTLRPGERAASEVGLVCLALAASPSGEVERPDRAEVLEALAARRGSEGLFGDEEADALCTAALLAWMSPRRQPATVLLEAAGAERAVVVDPDAWNCVLLEGPDRLAPTLSLRTLRREPVQFVALAQGPPPAPRWELRVTPRAGGVGSAELRLEPGAAGLWEARVPLPAGLGPYVPDLIAADEGPRPFWRNGELCVAAREATTLSFRVRAVRGGRAIAAVTSWGSLRRLAGE